MPDRAAKKDMGQFSDFANMDFSTPHNTFSDFFQWFASACGGKMVAIDSLLTATRSFGIFTQFLIEP